MKYLKFFETHGGKYKIGDYVLIDIDQVKNDIDDFQRAFGSKDRYVSAYIFEYRPDEKYCYWVRGFDYDDSVPSDTTSQTAISEDEISRLLTPEEIIEFESKKSAIKFNL